MMVQGQGNFIMYYSLIRILVLPYPYILIQPFLLKPFGYSICTLLLYFMENI